MATDTEQKIMEAWATLTSFEAITYDGSDSLESEYVLAIVKASSRANRAHQDELKAGLRKIKNAEAAAAALAAEREELKAFILEVLAEAKGGQ